MERLHFMFLFGRQHCVTFTKLGWVFPEVMSFGLILYSRGRGHSATSDLSAVYAIFIFPKI
jgi:hypothetical protein